MAEKLVTHEYRLHVAQQIIESISESANTAYYVFVGNHETTANSTIPVPNDSFKEVDVDAYNDMIFAKRVKANDAVVMVRRVDYTTGYYDQYDDEDTALFSKDFYAIVNAGAYSHVWKVLENYNGSNSTVAPDIAHIDAQDTDYRTSDGYRWKYLYSVSSTDVLKFATADYFPVFPNTTVVDNAADGAIDTIKVVEPGEGYSNYTEGTFAGTDLRKDGSDLIYSINALASSANDFYNGCVLYIKSGTGIGQYRKIVDYYVNSTSKNIVIDSAFTTAPAINSSYDISPGVVILGDGSQTSNAAARAVVNSVGNTISYVDVLTRGAGYNHANAYLDVSPVVPVISNATIRVVYSPAGGHGYDAASELGAGHLCISVKFQNTESNTIPGTNDFRTIGIIKDPLFVNVAITTTNTRGTFIAGETVHKISPIRVAANGVINTSSANVSASDGDFTSAFSPGDYVYITDKSTDDWLGVVNSVTNTTQIVLTKNGGATFTSGGMVYVPRLSSNAVVTGSSANLLSVNALAGTLSSGDKLIGENSGAYAEVVSVSRQGQTKTFDTLVNMWKYKATIAAGTFTPDETVTDTLFGLANGVIHSATGLDSDKTIYISNMIGNFNVGNTIAGETSGTLATITAKYPPEIKFGSGAILYLENIDPITRQNNQSETVKLILEF